MRPEDLDWVSPGEINEDGSVTIADESMGMSVTVSPSLAGSLTGVQFSNGSEVHTRGKLPTLRRRRRWFRR